MLKVMYDKAALVDESCCNLQVLEYTDGAMYVAT